MPSPGVKLSLPSIMRPTTCYAPDALLASNTSLNPGGKQPRMREGFHHGRGLPQAMVYSDNHPNYAVRGKPKGADTILRERGLWPHNGWRSDGFKFKLECPKNRGGCNPELDGNTGYCARGVLPQQQDFRDQKGQLQEEAEAANHLITFYSKFHCKLNFIERFWCAAKWYARENCEYLESEQIPCVTGQQVEACITECGDSDHRSSRQSVDQSDVNHDLQTCWKSMTENERVPKIRFTKQAYLRPAPPGRWCKEGCALPMYSLEPRIT